MCIRDRHARVFPRKLGQLVTDPTMVHTDQDGNVSQSLTGSATRNVANDFGAVTSTGFDGTSEALLKLGVWSGLSATAIETIHISHRGGFGRSCLLYTSRCV